MTIQVRQLECYSIVTNDDTLSGATVVADLLRSGAGLVAFSQHPAGAKQTRVELATLDSKALRRAAAGLKLALSERQAGIFVQGDGGPGVLADTLDGLDEAHIGVTAFQALRGRAGQLAALIWVAPGQLEVAKNTLISRAHLDEMLDEASSESFPASDVPSVFIQSYACRPRL